MWAAHKQTLSDIHLRELYTPLWDLNVAVWSDDAVARDVNFAQTDANTTRQLSVSGFVQIPMVQN